MFKQLMTKVLQTKSEALASELLDLQIKKKNLEIDKQNLEASLASERQKREMDIKTQEHKSKLTLVEAQAVFDRDRAVWAEDKLKIRKELHEDIARQAKILQEDFERKQNEVITLLKLESAQRTAQLELDYQRKIQELEAKHQEEIQIIKTQAVQEKMEYQAKMTEEYYDKMKIALLEGTATTKFVQELALKMLEKPLGATITESRLLINPATEG